MYQHGEVWISDFWCNGARYKKSWGAISKTVAREKERKLRTEILEGKHALKSKRILFETFAEKYLKFARTENKPKTAKRKEVSLNMLRPHFAGKSLGSINAWALEQYKKARKEEGRAPGTINRDIDCIKNMMKKAVEWDYLSRNPLHDVKRLKEENQRMWALTPEEQDKLLQACEKSTQRGTKQDKLFAKYLRDLVLVALKTGMRESEIFNIRKGDVHLQERYIQISESKTGEGRCVPINDSLRDLLDRRLQDRRSEYLFCNSRGEKLTVLTNAFWNAVKEAGLIRVDAKIGKSFRFRFHDLRHSVGSRLGMAGKDLKTIMEIMGHKTTKMAMWYQHPASSHKLDVVKILDEVPPLFTPEEEEGKEAQKVVNLFK
jgi:integrase